MQLAKDVADGPDPEGRTSVSTAPLDPAGVRFEDLPEQAWPRQEIFDGSLHVSPLAGIEHQRIVTALTGALLRVVPKEFEVLAGLNVLRRRTTDRLLIPDVAVVDAAAAQRASASGSASLPPEDLYLVVEVISPSSRETDLHLKRQFYAQWKIGTYWAVDPKSREIHEFGLRVGADTWLADVDTATIWPD
jgi:Uma2 family endonuclease